MELAPTLDVVDGPCDDSEDVEDTPEPWGWMFSQNKGITAQGKAILQSLFVYNFLILLHTQIWSKMSTHLAEGMTVITVSRCRMADIRIPTIYLSAKHTSEYTGWARLGKKVLKLLTLVLVFFIRRRSESPVILTTQ